jgi:hypothetical protein
MFQTFPLEGVRVQRKGKPAQDTIAGHILGGFIRRKVKQVRLHQRCDRGPRHPPGDPGRTGASGNGIVRNN